MKRIIEIIDNRDVFEYTLYDANFTDQSFVRIDLKGSQSNWAHSELLSPEDSKKYLKESL